MPNIAAIKNRENIMAIISSEVVEDRVQADGRRQIREKYIDDEGAEHFHSYLADASHVIDLVTYKLKLETDITARKARVVEEALTDGAADKIYDHIKDLTLPVTEEEKELAFERLFNIPRTYYSHNILPVFYCGYIRHTPL